MAVILTVAGNRALVSGWDDTTGKAKGVTTALDAQVSMGSIWRSGGYVWTPNSSPVFSGTYSSSGGKIVVETPFIMVKENDFLPGTFAVFRVNAQSLSLPSSLSTTMFAFRQRSYLQDGDANAAIVLESVNDEASADVFFDSTTQTWKSNIPPAMTVSNITTCRSINELTLATRAIRVKNALAYVTNEGQYYRFDETSETWFKVDFSGGGGGTIGDMKQSFAGDGNGWLICNGRGLSTTTYKTLFDTFANYFGNGYKFGGGGTTFNLPDFRGRTAVGANSADSALTLGAAGGNVNPLTSHGHSINQTPHSHWLQIDNNKQIYGLNFGEGWGNVSGGGASKGHTSDLFQTTETTSSNANISILENGNNSAHQNWQPFLATNTLIFTGVA